MLFSVQITVRNWINLSHGNSGCRSAGKSSTSMALQVRTISTQPGQLTTRLAVSRCGVPFRSGYGRAARRRCRPVRTRSRTASSQAKEFQMHWPVAAFNEPVWPGNRVWHGPAVLPAGELSATPRLRSGGGCGIARSPFWQGLAFFLGYRGARQSVKSPIPTLGIARPKPP